MGDENTLAGVTKAHKHSALSTDGGFIETGVTGVTNLSEGSIVYGDASEIVTELTAGATDTTLQINGAGLPVWASAGSVGKITLIDNTVLGADATEIDTTFTAIEQGTEMSGIMAVLNASRSTTNGFYIQLNDITDGTYHYAGTKIDAGVATYNNSPSNSIWQPYASGGLSAQNHLYFVMYFTAGDPTLASTADQTLRFQSFGVLDGAIGVNFWGTNSTSGQTEIDEIKIQAPTGNILEGSSLSIYKIGV